MKAFWISAVLIQSLLMIGFAGCGTDIAPEPAATTDEPGAADAARMRETAIAKLKAAGAEFTLDESGSVVEVVLIGTKIKDADLVSLGSLPNTTRIRLSAPQVTDAGLVHLKGLAGLKELRISYAQITNRGLVHLKGLSKLESLELPDTQFTDAGLANLRDLRNLEHLNVEGTQVNGDGLV